MNEWKLVGEWKPIDCPEYLFEVEEYRCGSKQMVFTHLHIWKWTKNVLKRIHNDFNLFRECVTCPIYTCGTADDDKFLRFVTRFGWKPFATIPCTDGKTRRLFIHVKNQEKLNVFQVRQTNSDQQPDADDNAVGDADPVSVTSVPRGSDGAKRSARC